VKDTLCAHDISSTDTLNNYPKDAIEREEENKYGCVRFAVLTMVTKKTVFGNNIM
jgi:hypothetical protein